MDPRTGEIFTPEHIKKLREAQDDTEAQDKLKNLVAMKLPPTEKQMKRNPPKVGRNERCPCGSGKKFKKCCLNNEKRTR